MAYRLLTGAELGSTISGANDVRGAKGELHIANSSPCIETSMNISIKTTHIASAVLVASVLTAPVAKADDEDVGSTTSELRAGGAGGGRSGPQLYRLLLKNGGRYLDHGCGRQVVLRSGGRRGDPCQLWQMIPQGQGWYRLKAAGTNKFLDADHCSAKVGLSGMSDYEGGACQAWRKAGNANGWSRLQLRHGSQYLDASYCKELVSMNPGSDYDGGSCQLWKIAPE